MQNHRGLTVSSAIGTIAEEIVSNKLISKAEFTQAQAGGRKGISCADHVFVLRNVIQIAKYEKRKIIVTFYDVEKAYDKADMHDMMYSMSKSDINGKLWRLILSLNENLTARVNTKVGPTRIIKRETGGKQGGKLMVPLFSKMMDNLAEDLVLNEEMGIQTAQARIRALPFVDDGPTMSKDYDQRDKTLEQVNEFVIKHKPTWGKDKCQVMELGGHKEEREKWKLGDLEMPLLQIPGREN